MPDVSVIVVSYNTADLLRRCLGSIASSGEVTVEVIVVDNASADGSADVVRQEFPAATLVELPTNEGFAAGVNRGADLARGRHLLLLNPDAALRPGTLEELVAFADRHPDGGIYGGRIVTPDGAVDPRSGFGLPTPWSLFCFAVGLSTVFRGSALFDPEALGRWPGDRAREVGAVSGALMLVDRSLWTALGGFDETYFMYSEDIDLCGRARAMGWRPLLDPRATAVHDVGASSTPAGKAVMVFTGKATYVRRRWRGPRRSWGLAMLATGVWLRAVLARRVRTDRSDVWPDVWDQRRHWWGGYEAAGPSVRRTAAPT